MLHLAEPYLLQLHISGHKLIQVEAEQLHSASDLIHALTSFGHIPPPIFGPSPRVTKWNISNRFNICCSKNLCVLKVSWKTSKFWSLLNWAKTLLMQRKFEKTHTLLFSCPEQLNRWPCHSLTHSGYFYFWHYRVTLETCDLWDICSEHLHA